MQTDTVSAWQLQEGDYILEEDTNRILFVNECDLNSPDQFYVNALVMETDEYEGLDLNPDADIIIVTSFE